MMTPRLHLPTAAELATAFVPFFLLEAQPSEHIGNALVCIIPASSLKLIHCSLQRIVRTLAACMENDTIQLWWRCSFISFYV